MTPAIVHAATLLSEYQFDNRSHVDAFAAADSAAAAVASRAVDAMAGANGTMGVGEEGQEKQCADARNARRDEMGEEMEMACGCCTSNAASQKLDTLSFPGA